MNFPDALNECLKGKTITNEKWNAKGQYVFMMRDYQAIAANLALSHGNDIPVDKIVTIAPSLMIKNAQDIFVNWVPSTGDIFSKDWKVVSNVISTNTSNSATVTYRDSKPVDCEMDFIEAFKKLKFEGKKIARNNWDGAYLKIEIGCDSQIGYIISVMKCVSKGVCDFYHFETKDILAKDWVVVE